MTKHELKETLTVFSIWAAMIVVCLFIVIYIGWTIYAFAKYGNQPITEVPSWALWFMWRS